MILNQDIFREYDIRGVYLKDFDESFAEQLGYHYILHLKNELSKKDIKISVGYDARLSSPSLTQALTDGILKAGGHVVMLDMITSPLSYFSCFNIENIDAAIMVTGSHNPSDHNGFKISKGKTTIHGQEIQTLKKLILNNSINLNTTAKSGTLTYFDIFKPYISKYTNEFKNKFANLHVTYDCGNGAAGVVLPQLFDSLKIKGEILFASPDGTFPNHHPDPSVDKNLIDLKKSVLQNKYDIGIGFDGDADRIGVVDDLGRHIYVDQFMILYAKGILKDYPNAPIIGDVKCSQTYFDKIKEYGGKPIMWNTGHSLIKEKVRAENSPFGGELSGHVFFNDRNYGYDDAIYASFRLLEYLALEKVKLSDFINQLPHTFTSPELRIDVPEVEKFKIVERLVRSASKNQKLGSKKLVSLNTIDGYRAQVLGGWALVRASNTQPAITIRFEANSEELLSEMKMDISRELDINLDI